MLFSIFRVVQPLTQSNLGHFHHSKKKFHSCYQSFPSLLTNLQSLPTTVLHSVSIDLSILRKQNWEILWLAPFTYHNLVACISMPFLFIANNILLYVYITFYLYIYQLMNTWLVSISWKLWMILLWTFVYNFYVDMYFYFSWVDI